MNAAGEQEVSGWAQFLQLYVVNQGSWVHILLYFALIIFFTYFYVGITFNPTERADELKKYGGFIPGIRPGRPTAEYLQYVLSRITLPGSIYLGIDGDPAQPVPGPHRARATTRTSPSGVPLCSSWSASGWIRSNRSRPS